MWPISRRVNKPENDDPSLLDRTGDPVDVWAPLRSEGRDIDMPGSMDGLKLARAIRDRWPPIELILTSGHFDVPEGDIPERGLFFSKPYRDEEIVSALRRFVCRSLACHKSR